MRHTSFLLLAFFMCFTTLQAQQTDQQYIRQLFDVELTEGQSHELLRQLCKDVGNRLSGSPGAEKAVVWSKAKMESMGFDTVYLQPIEVPVWVRGQKENFTLNMGDRQVELHGFSLGGSVGTNGVLKASVVEVMGLEDVRKLPAQALKGKIVFYNRPMDPRKINTFESYGGCVDQRYAGASEAAEKGAIGVIVRSMSLHSDHHPHTGSMGYKEGIQQIPAAAISTKDADSLSKWIAQKKEPELEMEMDCHSLEDKPSFNVIAELRGSVFPKEIIAFGGHLDSWDKGEGAHDDGAGVIHSLEALRLLKETGYQPRYTLRLVFFMNEENGNRGGKTYAAVAKRNNEIHVAAIESDRGGFIPRGFSIDGTSEQVEQIAAFKTILEPYGLHAFEKGYGGVDINPIKFTENKVSEKTILLGFVPDSQRYFDFHHADTDVWENVNKRELELGCASMASMIFLLDKYLGVDGDLKVPDAY